MNIDDLTIGQAKELVKFFDNKTQSNITQSIIGKYVIVRTRNEGINCGEVEMADDTGIVLKDARRIWYHKPKDKSLSWYEGVSVSGLSDDSKISVAVKIKVIMEDYSVTECTDAAIKSLKEFKPHEQS